MIFVDKASKTYHAGNDKKMDFGQWTLVFEQWEKGEGTTEDVLTPERVGVKAATSGQPLQTTKTSSLKSAYNTALCLVFIQVNYFIKSAMQQKSVKLQNSVFWVYATCIVCDGFPRNCMPAQDQFSYVQRNRIPTLFTI